MVEVISDTLGATIRYRQVPVSNRQTMMLQRGASLAMAQDMADMTETQNNGIYYAKPRDPKSATKPASASGARTSSCQPPNPNIPSRDNQDQR
jgi:hypothetical protein